MKKTYPLSFKEFVSFSTIYMLFGMIIIRRSVFRTMPGLSLENSKSILWAMAILSLVVGCLITYKKKGNNNLFLILTVIMPYEIYIAITYYRTIKTFLYITLLLSLSCAGFIATQIFLRPIKRKKCMKIIKNRIKRTAAFTFVIISICLSLIIVPLTLNILMGNSIIPARTDSLSSIEINNDYIDENINNLKKIKAEKWKVLDAKERLNILSIVANIESYKLGLPHELNIKVSNLGEYTISQYQEGTHTIVLNIDYLEESDGIFMVDSICHEAFHALQYCACEAYSEIDSKYKNLAVFTNKDVGDISAWVGDLNNYTSGDDNYKKYSNQSVEISAREYGEKEASYFSKLIEE